MWAALIVILLLILLFGGLGLWVSKMFLFGILVILLLAVVGGAYRRTRI